MKHFGPGKLTWSPLLKFVQIQLECYSIYVMIIVCDHVEMKKIGRMSEMISKKKQTRVILKIIENNMQCRRGFYGNRFCPCRSLFRIFFLCIQAFLFAFSKTEARFYNPFWKYACIKTKIETNNMYYRIS